MARAKLRQTLTRAAAASAKFEPPSTMRPRCLSQVPMLAALAPLAPVTGSDVSRSPKNKISQQLLMNPVVGMFWHEPVQDLPQADLTNWFTFNRDVSGGISKASRGLAEITHMDVLLDYNQCGYFTFLPMNKIVCGTYTYAPVSEAYACSRFGSANLCPAEAFRKSTMQELEVPENFWQRVRSGAVQLGRSEQVLQLGWSRRRADRSRSCK
jgi:hypothetical protein